MLTLSDKWVKFLQSQPETGMTYQIGTIRLRDGGEFPQAVIIQSTIISDVRGLEEIPFVEDDITRIEITHDKWDWKKEQ